MIINILKFAWRNIWRNKRRTFITLMAVAVGVMSLVFMRSYIRGVMNSATDAMVKIDIGHIKIAHKEYLRLKRIMPKEYLVPNLTDLQNDLKKVPEVKLVDSRLKFNVLLNYKSQNEIGVAVGIDPQILDENIKLSESIIEGQYMSGEGLELIIGKKLAEKLKIKVNDELLLVTTDINYSSYALPFKVRGIYETGFSSMDKFLLYIPLKKAQEMLDCGNAAHEILLFLKNPEMAIPVAKKIETILSDKYSQTDLRVIPWQKDELLSDLAPMIDEIWGGIMDIIMLIVGLVILNTMLMTVMERYHEIGVIKALGFKNREVFTMILAEAFYIGVIGAIIGGALGGPLSAWLEKTGLDLSKMLGEGVLDKFDIPIPMFARVLYPDFSIAILINSIIFGILVALIAVLYPAIKSVKMSPVEAFRSELKV